MAAQQASDGSTTDSSFGAQLGLHGAWRVDVAERLDDLVNWLSDKNLIDAGASERGERLIEQIKSDKVMVAFVAEFSRGKTELINAMFFASYGRRIMPAAAGRTTMCPTELGYDSSVPPCLRLLPIHTRLQPQAIMEWRMAPEKWQRFDLDVNDPEQLSQAMEQVCEVVHVTKDEARELGFWHDDHPDDNPPIDSQGMVEVPRWRHALINMAHPLLRQGLVILDTPGLNAIGAEPELTVNLIPQANAVVFILGADTGVTRSDLEIWRQHLATLDVSKGSRLVALNKIDTLWDELSTPGEIANQIARQCQETAHTLGLPADQVLALSAQKGLLAKVRGDKQLLHDSGLPAFEQVLADRVLGSRQQMLESTICAGVRALQGDALKIIEARRRELTEQTLELRSLRGKNDAVISQMNARIKQEKDSFDGSTTNMVEMRTLHMKMLRELFKQLSVTSIKKGLLNLAKALREPGVKIGLKSEYEKGFENLRTALRTAQSLLLEIHSALVLSFRKINSEYGFALLVAPAPDMERFIDDLSVVERSHLLYLNVGNMLQLSRLDFCEKLLRALFSRVRSIFETALGELELWEKIVFSQLDAQLGERRRAYVRRIDAIRRVQVAADSLETRLNEIGALQGDLNDVQSSLQHRVDDLCRLLPPHSSGSEDSDHPTIDLELEYPSLETSKAAQDKDESLETSKAAQGKDESLEESKEGQ